MSDPEPLLDDRAEQLLLSRALERTLRRREAMGARRIAPPAPLVEQTPKNALSTSPDPSPSIETVAPRPKATPVAPAACAPAMPSAPTAELDPDQVRERAAAVAALAAQAQSLEELQQAVAGCTACGLCATRTQTVFSDGSGKRGVFFLGEAPGEEEDLRGLPFVGPAGQLLTDIIEKGMQLPRAEVSIANVLKCRPPGNRDPLPAEKAICMGWLERQIELANPAVLVPLGRHVTQFLLQTETSMERLHGQVHQRQGRQVVPTWHPAHLLHTPEKKRECWQDIQVAMGLLGL